MSTNTNQMDYGYVDSRTASAVTKESQVNQACVKLEQALQELHKLHGETEQRLRPLLRNEPEAATNGNPQQAATMVPLAAQIDGYVREVMVAIQAQQSILRRLEL